ncbi:potassium-transporting ATPase potassium-binding subunit [Actinomycetospora sp. NBRC 106375]|uniref:potassium-transporting ATPase subunit KdpA n=1 Tax=Actinomycetospora sp. NBRC 106375 TaxID=3032207 RepID=UPI0024A21AC1|nr:potassium-transporting ATPase subunit KdpA [Actinomycetospora sp. NBRC 106375]GLZ45501.1 potassium-transporting ATPase potassium-binding subunit [Actinomycetospora sp. NBRC 106375]
MAGVLQVLVLLVLLAAAWRPLGDWMARVYTEERDWRLERGLYRLVRVDPRSEQRASTYAVAILMFSFAGIVLLYLLQRLQSFLPFAFERGAVDPGIAFNTAISFVTNTNWQSYVPETTMGHAVQMVGLTVQNFASAAVGMAVAVALVRGFVRARTDRLGNAWVDIVRGCTRVLLPIAAVAAVALVATGVVMSLRSGVDVIGADGRPSTIALAPAASQESIKELGTNGGGIVNANSAHPFENPNPVSDILEIFLLLVIPVSLTRTFGRLVGSTRQGVSLLAVMAGLWGAMLAVTWTAEARSAAFAGANLEGKEVRFGIPASALFATSTTGTSTGAVNSLHDSFSAFGGGGAMLTMLFSEMTPGGVGTGLYSILIIAVVAVFLAGLMVGRTPEYLGKRLGRREVTCAVVVVLTMPALVLLGTGLAIALPSTAEAMTNSGPHGLSEVLYAYASAANNNGSAFGGLTVTSNFFQTTLGVAMLLGRFLPIVAVLALAGLLARQPRVSPGPGTLSTGTPLFSVLVAGTIVLVAAITFLPALALSPLAEGLA